MPAGIRGTTGVMFGSFPSFFRRQILLKQCRNCAYDNEYSAVDHGHDIDVENISSHDERDYNYHNNHADDVREGAERAFVVLDSLRLSGHPGILREKRPKAVFQIIIDRVEDICAAFR